MNIKIISLGFILFLIGIIGFYFINKEVEFSIPQFILIFIGAIVLFLAIRPYIDKILRKYKKT